MRRKDREITDEAKIDAVIVGCHCCRLGFYDGSEVYIVPLNFGYDHSDGRRIFYFHGAKEGRKIDLINKTHSAGFELDTNYRLHEAKTACVFSAGYQSVIGTGTIEFIGDLPEKKHALQAVMRHNTGRDDWDFSEAALNEVCVFKLEVKEISCKEHL